MGKGADLNTYSASSNGNVLTASYMLMFSAGHTVGQLM